MGEQKKKLCEEEENTTFLLGKKVRIAAIVLIVILLSLFLFIDKFNITGFVVKEKKGILETNETGAEQIGGYGDAFYYAELTKPITEENIGVGILWGVVGGYSTECCIDHAGKPQVKYKPINVPFDVNQTVYLFEKEKYGKIRSVADFEKIKNLSREYIKKVYICIPKNTKVREELIPYFGEKTITKSSCDKYWIEESCCQDWHMP